MCLPGDNLLASHLSGMKQLDLTISLTSYAFNWNGESLSFRTEDESKAIVFKILDMEPDVLLEFSNQIEFPETGETSDEDDSDEDE